MGLTKMFNKREICFRFGSRLLPDSKEVLLILYLKKLIAVHVVFDALFYF